MEEEQRRPPVITADTLRSVAIESDIILTGSVLSIGKPPNGWSGYGSTFQAVTYKVEKILKGQYSQPEITIHHIVVSESLTAQEGDEPGLSPDLFAINNKLIVSAQKAPGDIWKSLSEDQGALPATDEYLRMMETALR